jgi:hypothetical protein
MHLKEITGVMTQPLSGTLGPGKGFLGSKFKPIGVQSSATELDLCECHQLVVGLCH